MATFNHDAVNHIGSISRFALAFQESRMEGSFRAN